MKFLFWVIAGFVALALAPKLLAGGGSAAGIGIGIVLLFFIAPAIARYLIGTMLGSIVGTVMLIGVVALLLGNPRACSSASLPIGDPGTVTDVARIGYLAESDYDKCLQGRIDDQKTGNSGLAEAAEACQADADRAVASCLGRIGEHWWNFDKERSCRAEISKSSWRTCATGAIGKYTYDSFASEAIGRCQEFSTEVTLFDRIPGLFSPRPATAPPSSTATSGSYDLDCLVVNYNTNNEAISKLIWTGKLPAGGCGQYTGTTALQGCLIQSLSALGPGGASVAASCGR